MWSGGVVSDTACYNIENAQLRSSVEELKALLYEARAQHFTQLDELRYILYIIIYSLLLNCVLVCRAEEVKYEGEVREEMAQLEALLAAAKRDYELLRIEFEKRLAANEQATPLAKYNIIAASATDSHASLSLGRELEVTAGSLQKTITQLKSEVGR